MPPGIQPPIIVQYNASSVPVLQLSLSSDRLNEQQLYDYGIYQMRQALAPIPGITLPTPYGGKYRQIMVDLDPDALRARGITPNDVLNAVNAQSLTLALGRRQDWATSSSSCKVNALAPSIDALNRLPIKQVGGTTVYLSDVAHVRDGWAVQQNIVRAEGKRSVLLTIIKNGDASTLDVVNRVKAALPEIQKAAPPGMHIDLLFDQSVFVQNAIAQRAARGRHRRRADGTDDPDLPWLVALDPRRDGVDPAVDPDLDRGAVGARPDHQHHDAGRPGARGRHPGRRLHGDDREHPPPARGRTQPFDQAVLEGAAGIAVPTLISTLAICCVFVSVFFLQGAARYLFTPLAMAVVFAMLASYAHLAHADADHDRVCCCARSMSGTAAPTGWLGAVPCGLQCAASTGSATSMAGCSRGILRRRDR